ncbi:MAG TPA: glycosyltransferase family 39 protein [Thermoanaerobaculia bacterium]|nr:glycosyltransferase family 39 protein [Thermoanaerobaculia bacterium]
MAVSAEWSPPNAPPLRAGSSDDSGPPSGRRWLVRLLLAALVIWSVAVRAWDASVGLHGGESFDERFSLANVAGVLAGKGLGPQQAYYPSLSYLPQAAVLVAAEGLHRATGIAALGIYTRKGGWSPTAYFLCRLTNVAFGALSLVLVFVVGRRLFGDAEGLAAAAVLAAFRRHVVSSAHFKPDMLVLLLTLLTFYWALLAVWRPRRRAFLRAGVGVGLATAAKYTGAGAALAVTAAALLGWRDRQQLRRRLGWLLLAGVAAVATFLLLNPWVADLYRFLMELAHGYSVTGVQEHSSPWVVLQRATISVLTHHGWTAWFVGGGVVALAWRVVRPAAWQPAWDEHRRTGAILLLVQTVGYDLAHAAVFPAFRAQNILPIAPFTSLVAGWAMVEAYRFLARAWRPVRHPAFAAALTLIATAALFAKPALEVYRRAVPSSWEVAAEALYARLDTPALRSAAYHGDHAELALAARRHTLVTFRARHSPPGGDADPILADAEAFSATSPPSWPKGPPPGESVAVTARPFRSRGEDVTILLHPWRLVRTDELRLAPTPTAGLAADLPRDVEGGAAVSISLWRRRLARGRIELVLQPGGRRLPLYLSDRRRGDQQLATRRFLLPPGTLQVELVDPTPPPRPPRLELHHWVMP